MKMNLKNLITLLFLLVCPLLAFADDDIMITRDGSMIEVKIEKISSSQITFIDLKHKKRGRLSAPTDFVYMIMREKGNNIFFDEEGNQTTSPVVKFDKKDDVMFLNNGKIFVIYNITINKDDVTYQLKDKKKAPYYKSLKSEVFMTRNADGTTTLYNNNYQKKLQEQQEAKRPQPTSQQSVKASQTTSTATSTSTEKNTGEDLQQQSLLASSISEENFHPAPELTAEEIETKVNAINPYTLYRKGSIAEYCFQHKGKQTQYMGGPTFLQQIVYDEKIVDGLLVSYVKQELFNKKHEPSKGIVASFKDCIFPTEIDTAGTFHLTHNLAQDFIIISKRRGYGVLIPGDMQPGMQLRCSTLYDSAKAMLGGNIKVETVYDNWQVEAEEQIKTPAGTFDCVKLTGLLTQKQGRNVTKEQITCWMARGVGIVQYETVNPSAKTPEPFVIYLNKLDLK